jgi:hypothetical protein
MPDHVEQATAAPGETRNIQPDRRWAKILFEIERLGLARALAALRETR